jgi:hypothetical protein
MDGDMDRLPQDEEPEPPEADLEVNLRGIAEARRALAEAKKRRDDE